MYEHIKAHNPAHIFIRTAWHAWTMDTEHANEICKIKWTKRDKEKTKRKIDLCIQTKQSKHTKNVCRHASKYLVELLGLHSIFTTPSKPCIICYFLWHKKINDVFKELHPKKKGGLGSVVVLPQWRVLEGCPRTLPINWSRSTIYNLIYKLSKVLAFYPQTGRYRFSQIGWW